MESVLNVKTNDKKTLRSSINKVICSFDKNPLNEVFIQPLYIRSNIYFSN